MPLRDHFHSPLSDRFPWNEIHGQWPGEMVRHLLTLLPQGFRAAPTARPGTPFEIDVGTYDERTKYPRHQPDREGETATLVAPSPTLSVVGEFNEEDDYEVRVYEDDETGRTLVAAIEIVSPANKDRPTNRAAFVTKCAALLSRGVCVSIIDLVHTAPANLYADLLDTIGHSDPSDAAKSPTYAATIRNRNEGSAAVETWAYPLEIGSPFPTLPIWLDETRNVLLDLETSYSETCRVLQIP